MEYSLTGAWSIEISDDALKRCEALHREVFDIEESETVDPNAALTTAIYQADGSGYDDITEDIIDQILNSRLGDHATFE